MEVCYEFSQFLISWTPANIADLYINHQISEFQIFQNQISRLPYMAFIPNRNNGH